MTRHWGLAAMRRCIRERLPRIGPGRRCPENRGHNTSSKSPFLRALRSPFHSS
jgi:hypothetical protein